MDQDTKKQRIEQTVTEKLVEVGRVYTENPDIPTAFKKSLFQIVIGIGNEASKLEEKGFEIKDAINFAEYDSSYNTLVWCLKVCRDFIDDNIKALEKSKEELDDEFIPHH